MNEHQPQQRRTYRRITPIGRFRPSAAEISEARFNRFLRDLQEYERKLNYRQTVDSFLDLYSQWMKTRQESLKLRLVMLAFELHALEPEFECQLTF